MPERLTTHLPQATLKFAAGDDRSRDQLSSTWYVRMTRGAELFVLNREAGGDRAHISIHKDGRCHYKIEGRGGRGSKHTEWRLQEPMDAEGLRRLASVLIPHRSLVLPDRFVAAEADTVLIPPPAEAHQLVVDIFLEPGPVPRDEWPGQTGMNAELVGRLTLYSDSPEQGLLNFTVVSTVGPESEAARAMSEASIAVADGAAPPTSLRAVVFQFLEVDDQKLPLLMEMPVGHMS